MKYESPGSFRMARGPPQTPVLGVTRLLPDDILAPPLTARPTAPVQVPAREESALEWLTRESTSEARDQFASNQVADQFTARGQFEGFEFLG